MTMILAILLAFILSALYAAFLALTDIGQWARQEVTWLTVVVGVGITLGCVALVDQDAAQVAVLFFAATGAPIVVESVLRMYRNHRAMLRRQMSGPDGD